MHSEEGGKPHEFDLNPRLSVLPNSVERAEGWRFAVRCEDCEAVEREPRSPELRLACTVGVGRFS